MKKIKALLVLTCCFALHELVSQENLVPYQKTVIVGSGIVGALEAYHVYMDALNTDQHVQIIVYEKGSSFEQGALTNTAYNVFPSLTPDEILAVVPRGKEFVEKLAFLFNQPGGIRVEDVPGANDSLAAIHFKQAVENYGQDPHHHDRTQNLLIMGKMSMDLWQNLYDKADPELKNIFDHSNFSPCREPVEKDCYQLHDGYRIDLIYEVSNAKAQAEGMQNTYEALGYNHCKLLSPDEVMHIDPVLTEFCMAHSDMNGAERVWKTDAAALWRPGGCLSAHDFLPSFYAYLKKQSGTYVDASGQTQDCFRLEFNKEVVSVDFDCDSNIVGLLFQDGSSERTDPGECNYIFCPGESVGTLSKLGFEEPAYAGFAGPSLRLTIPLSLTQVDTYKDFNHCMEVYKVGLVLAWQARYEDQHILLQAAGTKAFYGDKTPKIDEAFAQDRHLVQLNMMNDVLPHMVSMACGRDTKGVQLTVDDLCKLEEQGMLYRWVGRRAVAYDGFPTLGALFIKGHKVKNGRCTTHMGSGGASFAPAAVQISRYLNEVNDPFTTRILHYADSRR
jgi:hypothetical protein